MLKALFNGVECFVADHMLDLASILAGGSIADAEAHKKTGENGVPLEDLSGNGVALVSKVQKSVPVNGEIAALLEQTDSAADAGFGIAHVFSDIDTSYAVAALGKKIDSFQIHFGRFLQMHGDHLRVVLSEVYHIYNTFASIERTKPCGRGKAEANEQIEQKIL